ncbi:hypothetical protein BME96_12520 [Virgibacillus halodenitrificans]|uniref:Uncharacterized protein n=1 Tax=Virgibacillus halodenitrificans TaxID=1482 RepID=A0AAC9J3A4_VIRHA|nr:hypothetical protein [Virgibacillus halodenitrificans]APC48965.1 hypothetical protein BME96_12520 [Virgibacillus halodenitrificans]
MSKAQKESYYCMNCNWEIKDTHRHMDGIKCPECEGPVMTGPRSPKIILEISDPNEPPKVFVDGKEVKVKDINYEYVTGSDVYYETHELLMSVADNDNKHFNKIGFEK